jgi:hypothetical protein
MVDREAAVSPVVGVMLMLVVTVIIAAVVSSFAGGLANDEAKAPDAQIKFVGPVLTRGFQSLEFEHAGGDPIDMRDLQIQLRCGNTQCEFGYFDEFASKYGRYKGHLDSSVKYRFQKVGIGGNDGFENYCTLRPGEKFRVYADTNQGWGMMGFSVYRDGTYYSSIALEWGMGNSFTLTDRKSGHVYASDVFGAPQSNP